MDEFQNPNTNPAAAGFPEDMPMPEGFDPNMGPTDFPTVEFTDEDKAKKKKTIIVASIAGAIVAAAAVWGIISVVSNVSNRDITGEAPTPVETPVVSEQPVTANPDPASSPANEYTAVEETKKPVVASNKDTEETVKPVAATPETGPADLLLTAALVGLATALVVYNLNLKREA